MKIVVFSYSQSGQLNEILNNFILPLKEFDIDVIEIQPKKKFPFPWTSFDFFNAMPETVLEEVIELNEYTLKHLKYDLIILGYQPWFLSPSLPITSLVKSEKFKKICSNTPVVTVIGSRNMWINSQRSITSHINNANTYIVANIPFIDKNSNLLSAITILYWMLTGKKDKMLNIFPKPGVSKNDIENAYIFGEILKKHLDDNNWDSLQKNILNTNQISIPSDILFIEKRAKKLFVIWAHLIKKLGTSNSSRKLLIILFKYYLLVALFIVAPIVLIFYSLFVLPFYSKTIKKEKENLYYNRF